jgi:hypothetical protein
MGRWRSPQLTYRGYDSVLPNQLYRIPQEAVIDENVAMMEWWLAGKNIVRISANLSQHHDSDPAYSTVGTRLCHRQLMRWTIASSVERHYIPFSSYYRHSHAGGYFRRTCIYARISAPSPQSSILSRSSLVRFSFSVSKIHVRNEPKRIYDVIPMISTDASNHGTVVEMAA